MAKRGFHRRASNVKWLLRHILAPKSGAAVFHSPLDILGLQPKLWVPTGKQFYQNSVPCPPSSIGCKRVSGCYPGLCPDLTS